MIGLSSREKKVTVAYHLPEWIVRAIEELAINRGTNKSHEAGNALREGLARDPSVPTRVVTPDDEKKAVA